MFSHMAAVQEENPNTLPSSWSGRAACGKAWRRMTLHMFTLLAWLRHPAHRMLVEIGRRA